MKNILLAIVMAMSVGLHAQINVGSSELSQMNKAGKLSDVDINELKTTTTLFTLQQKDYDHKEDFEKAIASVWKLTKFKIIKPEEIEEYAKKGGYSFFAFGGYYIEKEHDVPGTNHKLKEWVLASVHLTYDLWIPEMGKKDNIKGHNLFARIMLSQDASLVRDYYENYKMNFKQNKKKDVYDETVFDNWGAGFLKGYLLTINNILMQGETRGRFTSDEDEKGIEKLKNDTLFVPDYVNVHFSPYTGEESDADKDQSSLKEVYTHPLKVITAKQLDNMLINNTTPFYYLVYVRNASDKFVNVYNSGHGLVFARYTPTSYNFKYKDLARVDDVLK